MFLREVKRTNRDGSRVSYLQLVHNEWDPGARSSRTKILYSFGRAGEVDTAAIKRLIASLSRLLDPASAFAATAGADLAFAESRPFGGTHVLEALWRRLGIDKTMSTLVKGSRITSPAERIIFALVANRALAPPRNWPPPSGSPATSISPVFRRPVMTPATGRWTGCMRYALSWRRKSTIRSPTC